MILIVPGTHVSSVQVLCAGSGVGPELAIGSLWWSIMLLFSQKFCEPMTRASEAQRGLDRGVSHCDS